MSTTTKAVLTLTHSSLPDIDLGIEYLVPDTQCVILSCGYIRRIVVVVPLLEVIATLASSLGLLQGHRRRPHS